ncbi:hypothetical protein BgiBS90_028881 [Biomphalaria glabrata]|nr:hypothetical protein BgiBS90_028881 [Biomphalaria glabrata]
MTGQQMDGNIITIMLMYKEAIAGSGHIWSTLSAVQQQAPLQQLSGLPQRFIQSIHKTYTTLDESIDLHMWFFYTPKHGNAKQQIIADASAQRLTRMLGVVSLQEEIMGSVQMVNDNDLIIRCSDDSVVYALGYNNSTTVIQHQLNGVVHGVYQLVNWVSDCAFNHVSTIILFDGNNKPVTGLYFINEVIKLCHTLSQISATPSSKQIQIFSALNKLFSIEDINTAEITSEYGDSIKFVELTPQGEMFYSSESNPTPSALSMMKPSGRIKMNAGNEILNLL